MLYPNRKLVTALTLTIGLIGTASADPTDLATDFKYPKSISQGGYLLEVGDVAEDASRRIEEMRRQNETGANQRIEEMRQQSETMRRMVKDGPAVTNIKARQELIDRCHDAQRRGVKTRCEGMGFPK